MSTILQSNIPHYHYLARALETAGQLRRYITSVALSDSASIPSWLPAGVRSKLEHRRVPGVAADKICPIYWPEIVQRTLPRLRLASNDRADALHNEWFDRQASRWVGDCDTFHFVSSVGLYSAQKAKRLGARIVCDVRQEHPAFQRRILQEEGERWGVTVDHYGASYEARVLDEFAVADRIIVPSEHARRSFLAEGFAPSRVFVLPYGVDLGHYGQTVSQPRTGGPLKILYAGAVTLRKGLQYLLEAMALLGTKNYQLTIAGPRRAQDLDGELERHTGRYTFLGPQSKGKLIELYQSHHVFVLPSLADSFSLATFEAMAAGLPVIVSHNTGAGELLEEGREGFRVPIRDAGAIAERLAQLGGDEELRQSMSEAARRRAQRQTWAVYEEQARQWYEAWHAPVGVSA